jgi:hypothetical protein
MMIDNVISCGNDHGYYQVSMHMTMHIPMVQVEMQIPRLLPLQMQYYLVVRFNGGPLQCQLLTTPKASQVVAIGCIQQLAPLVFDPIILSYPRFVALDVASLKSHYVR